MVYDNRDIKNYHFHIEDDRMTKKLITSKDWHSTSEWNNTKLIHRWYESNASSIRMIKMKNDDKKSMLLSHNQKENNSTYDTINENFNYRYECVLYSYHISYINTICNIFKCRWPVRYKLHLLTLLGFLVHHIMIQQNETWLYQKWILRADHKQELQLRRCF